MPAIRSIAIGILILMLSGCGQLVSERLTVTNSASADNCPITRKLVVLPLADYSYVDDTRLAMQRNLAIMENLTDQLVSRGYQLPVQEDLIRYLTEQEIIKVRSTQHSLDRELKGAWSQGMKDEFNLLIKNDVTKNGDSSEQKSVPLDQMALAKIAGDFGAGYIMRGRILSFKLGEETTWNPLKKGLLPVIIGGTNRALLGVAKSEAYDFLSQVAVGGIVANNISEMGSLNFKSASSYGMGAGAISSQSQGASEARVELRLWVQSPETGNVIWTNRVEVKVRPQTIFADTDSENLFNVAITKAVSALVNDFANKMQ